MGLFGNKNKHHTTDRRSDDLYDSTHDHQDTVNTAASRDYNPNDYAVHNQPTESSYQTSSFNNSTSAGGTSHGIGSADTGMTGLHHQHQPRGHDQGPTVGAASLREQAMLYDREAQNFRAQSKELAEAEALEEKAREHRERAVAQGAHPHNKYLGGNAAIAGADSAPQTRTGQRTTGF